MRSGAAQALGEDEAESDGWDAGDRSDLRRAIQFRSAPEQGRGDPALCAGSLWLRLSLGALCRGRSVGDALKSFLGRAQSGIAKRWWDITVGPPPDRHRRERAVTREKDPFNR